MQLQAVLQPLLPQYTFSQRGNFLIVGNGLMTGVRIKLDGPQSVRLNWVMPNMGIEILVSLSIVFSGILPGLVLLGLIWAVVSGEVGTMKQQVAQALTTGQAQGFPMGMPGAPMGMGAYPMAPARPGGGLLALGIVLILMGLGAFGFAANNFSGAERAERYAQEERDREARNAVERQRCLAEQQAQQAAEAARLAAGSRYGSYGSYGSRYGSYGSSYRRDCSSYSGSILGPGWWEARASQRRTSGGMGVMLGFAFVGGAVACFVARSRKVKAFDAQQPGGGMGMPGAMNMGANPYGPAPMGNPYPGAPPAPMAGGYGPPPGAPGGNPFGGGPSQPGAYGAPPPVGGAFGAPPGGAPAGNPFAGGPSQPGAFGAPPGGAPAQNPFGAPTGAPGAPGANPFGPPSGGGGWPQS